MAREDSDLLGFVASVAGERTLRVEENLGEGFVRLRVAEAERRQAKHDIRCVEDVCVEMLRNSRDAHASKIFVATTKEADKRTLVLLDDGDGIPSDMQERVFDARVTSKLETMHMDRWGVHGRGMALYSVRENAESASVMDSGAGLGCSIRVITDATRLSERRDQSTWPSVGTNDDGEQSVVRGPHNIIRACCEFALEEKGVCEVFLGSPAEIVATIRQRVAGDVDRSRILFCDNLEEFPVTHRLYAASDAQELMEVSASLGLDMSERTAHRILAGQIRPVRSVLAHLLHRKDASSDEEIDLIRDRRGLRLSSSDAEEFSRIMERSFDFIASRSYLRLASDPKVRVSKNRVTVTFDLDKDD